MLSKCTKVCKYKSSVLVNIFYQLVYFFQLPLDRLTNLNLFFLQLIVKHGKETKRWTKAKFR
jgi:hypothetical protein